MKPMIVMTGLVLATLAGCSTGAVSHTHLGNLSDEETANFARGARGCDYAGADAARDPTSPCYLAGRRGSR